MRSECLTLVLVSLAAASSTSCKDKGVSSRADDVAPDPAPLRPEPANTSIDEFLAKGPPTFVIGTQGDKRSDQVINAQVGLVRNIVAPSAAMLDSAISVDEPGSWPARPILYGGSSFNRVIDQLSGALPLAVSPGKLAIGGKEFRGPGFQVIAVIPAQAEHPEFALYAGTGTPGVAEINAVRHGPDPILIADSFGALNTGKWTYDDAGRLTATLGKPARRVEWREVERELDSIFFVAGIEPSADEAAIIANCEQGVATARTRLGLGGSQPISIYVSPDARSKVSLTGKAGDGHAVPGAGALHVVGTAGDALRHVVAHEATHVLAYSALAQAGSSLLGEGLAVWVSGRYADVELADFVKELGSPLVINELLGPKFRRLPEREAYMHAGLVVQAVVDQVGIEQVGQLLLGANRDTWESACERAGSSMAEMQKAYAALFDR